MDAIQLFAALLAQRGRVRSVEYSSFPAYDNLIKAGLIEEFSVVSSMICDECDHPHDAKIVFEGSQYGYYCPQLGFVSKPRSELIAVQPNLSAFVSQVADALDCKRRKSAPLDKDTWRIGAIESTAGDVVLYLHPTLQEARDLRGVQAALASEVRSPFGVILTSSGTLTAPPFVTAQLDDVLSFDSKAGKLSMVADVRAIAGVPEQRTGGRPNEYERPLSELIALRASQGRALKGRNVEARAIIVEFKSQFPNIDCPSLPTVQRYVTKIRSGS
ncbi:hypothetical protein JQV19_15945 [Sulfitobacter mediterraneus]|uniref:hypothetical protein n=1 Tax=Sulfitobacter mediterraneus TaxID=83219 RepID=UPI0019396893|nr:hypothetical protein [Sulfitobacter mediterraneus]MBM1557976.1 hypothetical protein [Sulfitobacter mediterraneus]MBM1569596.1 hypothetical protein [Sulfitobacter mediterraneus]MBM1573181.1 hypothetical protein [Sulfitobacter mediterraneus]MBM1577203.1 hypothetical protein [Sulfitobacter mediterraneus]MBM1580966.1 hypothetical protein [Sulfitobacter mediterraneus]